MKRILILVALSLFLCSTASAFQGGGGESTKKGSTNKKADTKKKNSGTKSNNTTPPRPPAGTRPAPKTQESRVDALAQLRNSFVKIPAGEFMMGSETGEADEKPAHGVTISQPFYLGKYEVTQAQWQAVMGNNPSNFKGANLPVEQVSWDDAQQFIQRLNARSDGYVYRLPTEAEWEYACRAGSTGDYAGNLDAMAWYDDNSGSTTHPVGQKQPNAWGLYDMHGNVWEWCQDWYGSDYYAQSPSADPTGPSTGSPRVVRGGSWFFTAPGARSAFRSGFAPDYRDSALGFRVLRTYR